jgi:hypothetical protein
MIETFFVNCVLVALAVLVHFEAMNLLSLWVPRIPVRSRLKILAGVFGALFAHVIEIWLFALGLYCLLQLPNLGQLVGGSDSLLMDCVYLSFTSFTSLGVGDIYLLGAVRFLSGVEALTGLVLIAWTASFMYIEMQKLWRSH